jgi:quinoprotein glucose dehydrogenase
LLKGWAAKADIPAWGTPSAKNSIARDGRAQCQRCDTCYPVCPTGAKYSPDWTWERLVAEKKITLVTNTLVRRLEADAAGRLTGASGNMTDASGEAVQFRAAQVVLAAGFVWSAHLLLLSRDAKHPDGLANRSGLVGKYLCGHRNVGAQIRLPMELYPGMNVQHSLVSRKFMHLAKGAKYLRNDLRIWESSVGREPRLRGADGGLLLGDALLADWRGRAKGATARVRAYYDVLPDKESKLVLDGSKKNRFGDPMPHVEFRDAPASAELRGWQESELKALFHRMAKAGDGEVISIVNSKDDLGQEHPGGGCRMGNDPATSVVDKFGRAHNHENLWVAGAPTHVSASCCNGTLTFAATGLRTAAAVAGKLS